MTVDEHCFFLVLSLQVMCDKNIVKIGVRKRRDFHIFQAADETEAATLTDCLNTHAKKASEGMNVK